MGVPEIGLGLSGTGREYILGWRLAGDGSRGSAGFQLSTEARRIETTGGSGPAEHRIGARLSARWYAAALAARLEVLVEYRARFAFTGRANFLSPESRQSVAADLSSFAGMLAAYIDLPGLGVLKIGPLGPFVGAGLGAVRTRIGQTRMTFPATTTIVPGANRTGFAWMVTAGAAVALGERVTVDLAWRYTDLGAVHTGRGAGRVIWRDGSREPLPLDLDETRARLAGHGLRLSLRYAF